MSTIATGKILSRPCVKKNKSLCVLLMAKKKPVTKKNQTISPAEAELLIGNKSTEYEAYLVEHKKRLKQLQREYSGDNMETPWYEE